MDGVQNMASRRGEDYDCDAVGEEKISQISKKINKVVKLQSDSVGFHIYSKLNNNGDQEATAT